MSQSFGLAPKLSQDVPKVLSFTNTESCSVLLMRIGAEKEETYQLYRMQATGELQLLADDDGALVYPIGSLTKLLVAIALHLIVDIYRTSGKPEHRRYRRLTGWKQEFVDAYNNCSPPEKMEPLLGRPTLGQLLIHLKGLPDVNRFILAPDGTPLMSVEEFIKIAPHLSRSAARETGDTAWLEYSNGNYILIGILIEAVSGMTLGEFLKTEILEPLKMDRTYVNAEELKELNASQRAVPHIVKGNGRQEAIEDRVFMSNSIEVAALGIYSCTRDLGRLYEALLPTSADQSSYKILNKESVARLFGNDNSGGTHMSERGDEKWADIGLVTTTNGLRMGSRSITRLVLSDDEASSFALGIGHEGVDLEIFYQAGSVSAFSGCSYIVQKTNEVVIVLTNTLGQGDAADYTARLILQDRGNLKVPGLAPLLSAHSRVNVVEKARRGSQRFFQHWQELLAVHDSKDDSTILDTEKIIGLYKNEQFRQSLVITANEDELSVEIQGGARRSRKMRLARIGIGKLQICQKIPGIDSFGAWKDLKLHYESGRPMERVSCLSSTTTLGETECEIRYVLQSEPD